MGGVLHKKMNSMRYRVSSRYLRRVVGSNPVTIVSDDCWGGTFYRHISRAYESPFAGLWVEPKGYLHLLQMLSEVSREPLQFVSSKEAYPVAEIFGVRVHFMHYKSESEVHEKWVRRMARADFSDPVVKIDFGKDGYCSKDIDAWNALCIRRKLAVVPDDSSFDSVSIDSCLVVSNWDVNGREMYGRTLPLFVIHRWLQEGVVKNTRWNRALWNFDFPEI